MGAFLRFSERRTERELRRSSRRGVLEPAERPEPAFDVFVPGADAGYDTRAGIPALGLREYWYPLIEARKVKAKPVYWVMLGEELGLFRNKDGSIAALSDGCPHRGASLSSGNCFYHGTVTCPYHGATFDRRGECVAWLSEGPDSFNVGRVAVRHFPTRTLKGWVRHMYTRYAVPVEANLSRIVIFHARRLATKAARTQERVYFALIHNWLQNYNFSAMDSTVSAPCRFWTPENLSPTDSHLVILRRLIRERSRDALRRRNQDTVAAGG